MYKHLPEYIRTLKPYVPGKPIGETKREYGLREVVKLASNENPFGSSPLALEAVKMHLEDLHRYPDASAYYLKKELALKHQVEPELITIGNGSNDIVDMIVRTCCMPGDSIVISEGAFIAYQICAQIHGVEILKTKLREDYRFDLEAMLELVRNNEKASVVFIPNPNNPTGTYVNESELVWFLTELRKIRDDSVLAVLDYAYWEYVTADDLPDPHVIGKKFPSAMILHTFSKIYGLAGLRIGYGVGPAEFIGYMERIRQPFNNNSLALIAAEAALKDHRFVKKSMTSNRSEMANWERNLSEMAVPFVRSQGNFILINAKKGFGVSGMDIQALSLKEGVIFRPVANYGLPEMLRITIGTTEENEIAIGTLRKIQKMLTGGIS